MEISVRVDVPQNTVEITLSGQDGAYFAYGFGNTRMRNTYVIMTQSGTITERKLAGRNEGDLLSSSFGSSTYNISGNTGTTSVTRPIQGPTGDHFSFPTEAGTFSIIWAYGNSNTLQYHAQRGITSITLAEEVNCENTFSTINETACESYTSPSGNNTYSTSGTYEDVIPNAAGCDSIITINLTIETPPTRTTTVEQCEPFTSAAGNTYTESGQYTENRPAPSVCDSLITLDITILEASTSTQEISSCAPVPSPSGNSTYEESGTYRDTLVNTAGCDSIVLTNFTLTPLDTSVTITDTSLVSNAAQADSYQWVDCNSNFAPIAGATEAEFIPEETGSFAVIVSTEECTDTSACKSFTITNISNERGSLTPARLFPNPSNGSIRVLGSANNTPFQLQIVGLDGKIVFAHQGLIQDATELQLPISEGTYLARLQFGREIATQRLIIKK